MIDPAWWPGDDWLVQEIPLNVRTEFGRGRVPPSLVLLHRLADDSFNVTATGPVYRTEPHGICLPDCLHRLMQLAADEVRKPARQKFKEDHPERVNIAAGIDLQGICRYLLRAHVFERTHQFSRARLTGGVHLAIGRA